MPQIIAATLLLLILVDSLHVSTATSPGFYVSKKNIRKCRCRVCVNGMIKCPSPLLPTNPREKRNLIKCLCSKTRQTNLPEFQAACMLWHPGFPLTLL